MNPYKKLVVIFRDNQVHTRVMVQKNFITEQFNVPKELVATVGQMQVG